MQRATSAWLADPCNKPEWAETFASKLNRAYVAYGSMVILPSGAFNELQPSHASEDSVTDDGVELLYRLIAHHLKASHIAITRPIPLQDDEQGIENIIRAPKNFLGLYGDFGPVDCTSPPSQQDFNAAYWVTAKQNGISQTWAPRWTMFSRGNISEKARLLTLPSVVSAIDEGKHDGRRCAAVDLYAGIGYFTFSYLKAGIDKVLGWDLNPWSIEGLMRGAKANKWAAIRSCEDELANVAKSSARLIVFNEDNAVAEQRISHLRSLLPPIRHVNCGLLPTSRGSWWTAVNVLDLELGGWIHVHENFAVNDIGQKAEEVRTEMQRLVGERAGGKLSPVPVTIEHVNKLKSYAPGVMHCVLDVHVAARKQS